MKCFNRTKLIPSLAASAMVAIATFAPLPGFLAAGNVYAYANTTTPRIEISRLARLNLAAEQGHNGVDVQITYKCSPLLTNTAGTVSVTVDQTTGQSGSGVAATGTNPTAPIKCDGHEHQVAVTVTPDPDTDGAFNVCKATVTATLTDPSGFTTLPKTKTVNVEV